MGWDHQVDHNSIFNFTFAQQFFMKQNYPPKTWHRKIFMFRNTSTHSWWIFLGTSGGVIICQGTTFFSLKGPETTVTWRFRVLVKGRFASFILLMVQKSGDHQFCMAIIPLFTWFHSCQVVQDFFQQYFFSIGTLKCKFDTRSILSPFYQDYGYSRNLLASILLKSIPFCSCLTCSVTHWWIRMFKMLWVQHDKTFPRNTIIIFERTRNLKRTHLKESFEEKSEKMILIQITDFFGIETHRVQEEIAMERCQQVLQGPQHLSWAGSNICIHSHSK